MDLVPLALISICLIILLNKFGGLWKFIKFTFQVDRIPGPGRFGSIWMFFKFLKMTPEARLTWTSEWNKEYNGFFKIWTGMEAVVYIRNPKFLEMILSSTMHIKKSLGYQYLKPWLGHGLLTSTGDKWFRDRRLLTPAFHFNILDQFGVVINEKTQIFVNCLENEIKKNKPGTPIEIFTFAIHCTLDIICGIYHLGLRLHPSMLIKKCYTRVFNVIMGQDDTAITAMGLNIHAQENNCEYACNVHKFSRLLFSRIFTPWNRIDFFYYLTKEGKEFKKTVAELHKFTENVIRARKLSRMQKSDTDEENTDNDIGTRKRKAFLDLLLDVNENSDNPMTDTELREQVDTFMFTGHDTTAAAISWTLFCLGNEPKVQEELHQELDRVFGDSKEVATVKQLSELKYLDRVMKEALRLYPVAPEFFRELQIDLEINGHFIPKEASLGCSPYEVHRDPEYWVDPLKFDPDRFLPENILNRHPYAYIPFSAGPRNCIGQKFAQLEEKIVLTAVLRKFRFKSMQTHDEINLYMGLVLRPSHGIHMQLTPKY